MRPRFVPTNSKTRALTVKVNGDPPLLARGRKWWLFARSIARGAASYRRKKFGRTATRSLAPLIRRMDDPYAQGVGVPIAIS
jgi:hypothetical protein